MLTARDGEITENQQMVRLNSGENNPDRKQVQKLKLFEHRKWGLVIHSLALSSISSLLENTVQITVFCTWSWLRVSHHFVSNIESLSIKELQRALLTQNNPYFNSRFYLLNYRNKNILSLKFPGLVCTWCFVYRGSLSKNYFKMKFKKTYFQVHHFVDCFLGGMLL